MKYELDCKMDLAGVRLAIERIGIPDSIIAPVEFWDYGLHPTERFMVCDDATEGLKPVLFIGLGRRLPMAIVQSPTPGVIRFVYGSREVAVSFCKS